MATNNQDAQLIAREIGNVLTRLMNQHQSFLSNMQRDSNDNNGRNRNRRRTNNNNNNTPNVGLSRAIQGLNRNVNQSSSLFQDLNRQLRENIRLQNQQVGSGRNVNQQSNRSTIDMSRNSRQSPSQESSRQTTNDDISFFGTTMRRLGTSIASSFSFAKGLKTVFTDIQSAASTSSDFGLSTQTNAIAMGASVKDLLTLQAQFRTDALRTSGGVEEWTQSLRDSQLDMLAFTGSLIEANKANAAIRSTVMDVGVSFSEATKIIGSGRDGFVGELKKLSSATGQTIIELNNSMKSIVSSDETRFILQKMDKSQRSSFLLSQASERTRLVKLTGSLEKADQLLKSQQNEAKKTYKERFIEAAKLSAAAGRLGMNSNSSQRLAELTRKNPALRTADDRKELLNLRNQLSQAVSEMAGSGDARTEIMANALMDQFGLSQLNDKNLATFRGLNGEATSEHLTNNISATIDGNQVMKKSLEVQQQIATLIDNGFVNVLTGMAISAATGGLSRASSFIRGGAGATSGLAGRASSAASSLRNVGGRLASGLGRGGLIGAGTALAGIGIDQFYNPNSENQETGKNVASSVLQYGGIGAALGSFVPVLGTAIGGAIGVAVGGIVGLMAETKKQIEYDNSSTLSALDSKLKANNIAMKIQTESFKKSSSLLEAERNKANNIKDNIEKTNAINLINLRMDNEQSIHNERMKLLRIEQEASNKQFDNLNKIKKARSSNNTFSKLSESMSKDGIFSTGSKEFDPSDILSITGMTADQLVEDLQRKTNIDSGRASEIRQLLMNDIDIMNSGKTRQAFEAIQRYISVGLKTSNGIIDKLQPDVDKMTSINSIKYDFNNGLNLSNNKNRTIQDLSNLVANSDSGTLSTKALLNEDNIKDIFISDERKKEFDKNNDGTLSLNETLLAIRDLLSSTRSDQRDEFDKNEQQRNLLNNQRNRSKSNQFITNGALF
jgi:hypothetical protein